MTLAAAVAGLSIWWVLQIPVFLSRSLEVPDKILISVWSLIVLLSIPVMMVELLRGFTL